MATSAEQRYGAATQYVRRAIDTVDPQLFSWSRLTTNYFSSAEKVQPARNDLARLAARWQRATSQEQREQLARAAELLADRVQESLPGAPQDRSRTNLYHGEHQASTAPSSYIDEVDRDFVAPSWHWLKDRADDLEKAGTSIAKIGLWIGGAYLGFRALEALAETRRGK